MCFKTECNVSQHEFVIDPNLGEGWYKCIHCDYESNKPEQEGRLLEVPEGMTFTETLDYRGNFDYGYDSDDYFVESQLEVEKV